MASPSNPRFLSRRIVLKRHYVLKPHCWNGCASLYYSRQCGIVLKPRSDDINYSTPIVCFMTQEWTAAENWEKSTSASRVRFKYRPTTTCTFFFQGMKGPWLGVAAAVSWSRSWANALVRMQLTSDIGLRHWQVLGALRTRRFIAIQLTHVAKCLWWYTQPGVYVYTWAYLLSVLNWVNAHHRHRVNAQFQHCSCSISLHSRLQCVDCGVSRVYDSECAAVSWRTEASCG